VANIKLLQNKARVIEVAFIVVIVVGLSVAAFIYLRPGQDEGEQQTPAERVQDVAVSAQDAQLSGDTEAAKQQIDDAIDYAEGDKVAQADAYNLKSTIAYKDKDYQAALDAALKAEELDPTTLTSALVAKAARGLNDNETAAKYYRITIDRIKAAEFHNETDVEHYENQLKEVQ
jgi:tetratricopeptide (TPR) repeat protein